MASSSAHRRRAATFAAATLLVGGALTACTSDGADESGRGDGPRVVASTSVYGDIARRISGDSASVESVVSDPTADPHSFDASPAEAARVTAADLVVYNGAGYDSFVDRALGNSPDVPVVRAVDEFARVASAELEGSDTASNEHVWFSPPTVTAVADRIADELARLDAANAPTYQENAREFAASITPLISRIEALHDRGNLPYAQTEPVGAHLFALAQMDDATPRGLLAAVEDDSDPSAADLAATLDLLREHRVAFLAYNTQTATGVTGRIRDTAGEAGVPVVEITETLPDGQDYVSWMTHIVDDLESAVAAATDPATVTPRGR